MSTPAQAAARVLAFDVFGTLVDWHGTVRREIDALELDVDGAQFASAWRAGYVPAMMRVANGELPWTKLDDLHRGILDQLLTRFGVTQLDERSKRHLNRIWHRLDAWPDAAEGLKRLRRRFLVCTLSNGNLGLLAELSKHAELTWDCILSAEVFRKYKPDPATYLGVAETFDVEPQQVLMVAAHDVDLVAAQRSGLMTAFITRPLEYGPGKLAPEPKLPPHTLVARDLNELATLLEC